MKILNRNPNGWVLLDYPWSRDHLAFAYVCACGQTHDLLVSSNAYRAAVATLQRVGDEYVDFCPALDFTLVLIQALLCA